MSWNGEERRSDRFRNGIPRESNSIGLLAWLIIALLILFHLSP